MTNTEALQAILAKVGEFTGMPMQYVQMANAKRVGGKVFEPPKDDIWAKVYVKNAGSRITEIGEKPNKRTVGIVYVQLFAPQFSGTLELSKLADKWAEHLQYYKLTGLELREASIIDVGESNGYYQFNVQVSYVVN